MKAYSEDLRRRVVRAVAGGRPGTEIVEQFAVSLATLKRWLKQERETGELAPKPVPGPVAVKRRALEAALPARLREQADATLEDLCTWWLGESGVQVSTATMSRAISALGWTRKKDAERERTR